MIISCDDGCNSDTRLAELAHKYDIECVFYWPVDWHSLALTKGWQPLSVKDAIAISRVFEIGSHGLTHKYLTRIPKGEAEYEIQFSKVMLQRQFQVSITKFAPARGYTSDALTRFTYKFYDKQRLTKGLDDDGYKLVHVHPDSGANDNKPWRECMTDKTHLWMHSVDLDRFLLWDELEEALKTGG